MLIAIVYTFLSSESKILANDLITPFEIKHFKYLLGKYSESIYRG